jgi:hypothetical protein
VHEIKVSQKPSPASGTPKLRLVMKKSTTISPGSGKNRGIITKAGHVTDQVSDFRSSSAKKEVKLHVPPTSNKRPAEASLEKEDQKKLKISLEPPSANHGQQVKKAWPNAENLLVCATTETCATITPSFRLSYEHCPSVTIA